MVFTSIIDVGLYSVCYIYNKKALLNVQKPDYSEQDYMHLYLHI